MVSWIWFNTAVTSASAALSLVLKVWYACQSGSNSAAWVSSMAKSVSSRLNDPRASCTGIGKPRRG